MSGMMTGARAPHLRFLLLALLLAAGWLASPPICRAQNEAVPAAEAPATRTASVFLQRSQAPLRDVAHSADIQAFTSRELAFGLFVLMVGFVGLLVLLPAGLKQRSGRRGHRNVFR